MIVIFNRVACTLHWARYQNGRPALVLRTARDRHIDGDLVPAGAVWATATVNLPHVALGEGVVAIKDYSENEGMLAALVAARVVAPPHDVASEGFVKIPLCQLLVTPDAPIYV